MYNTRYLPENFEQRICLRKQFYDTFHLIEHAFQIDLPSFKMAKKTMKVLRRRLTNRFCNQNLGNQNVPWTFGGRGFCPGRFFVTNKHRKTCNNPYITSSLIPLGKSSHRIISSCHPLLK